VVIAPDVTLQKATDVPPAGMFRITDILLFRPPEVADFTALINANIRDA